MSRPDPSDRPSDRPPKRPEADTSLDKPKGGTSKDEEVVQARWEDSEDYESSSDSDDEEGGGGGPRLIQPKTEMK